MSFAEVVARSWDQNRLFSALLELTYRCNLDCFYCYNDLSQVGQPLSREQYDTLLEDLARMQVFQVILSGGEPLAHPHFFAIGARARALGFVVRVKSNGHALSGDVARRLKREVDPFVVDVSLHGARPESHDRQTRVPGSFERLMSNLPAMVAEGLRVRVNSTLTAWNEDEYEGMYALIDRLGLRLSIAVDVTPRDDGDLTPLSISASEEGVERLIAFQKARGKAGAPAGEEADPFEPAADADLPRPDKTKHCGAGAAVLSVDPYGNVYPCVQWREAIGNLHRQGIEEIWRGGPELGRMRRQTEELVTLLPSLGVDLKQTGFCPGLAFRQTGSPVALYPAVKVKNPILLDISRPIALPSLTERVSTDAQSDGSGA